MLLLKLNTVLSVLAHCSNHSNQPFVIFKLGEYKEGWRKSLNYLFTGDMEKWGPGASVVCPLWGSFLSYIPRRTGMFTVHLYDQQFQRRKTFLQLSTSKITNRIERRGTRIGKPSSSRSLILMKQAPC